MNTTGQQGQPRNLSDQKKPGVTSQAGDTSKDGGKQKDASTNQHASERRSLNPKDEIKVLKNWGVLKRQLILGQIIDPLIEKGIYSPDAWQALKNKQVSEPDKVEDFLYHLIKCKPEAYGIFLDALHKQGFAHVGNQLEGVGNREAALSVTIGSGSSHSRIGRPHQPGRMYQHPMASTNMTVHDPRSGASASHLVDSAASGSSHSSDSTVRQEDLHRMKDEITEELRQLRLNIERDRDQDRLELQLLQRKHSELHDDLDQAKSERAKLVGELTNVTSTVQELKTQMDKKEEEYRELRRKNKELMSQLETRAGDLQKLITQKEAEKAELLHALRLKEADYKKLQGVLESVKGEQEERLTRLKGVTKDKVQLEKEVQLVHKDKKNLEVKIKSLEQHIYTLQEAHARETYNIRSMLEKQKTLLEEKEKERRDLEQKLEDSVRENENLKQKNRRLEENLEKIQDEQSHLQQKVKQAELSSYGIPPFLPGSKSTSKRLGWRVSRTGPFK